MGSLYSYSDLVRERRSTYARTIHARKLARYKALWATYYGTGWSKDGIYRPAK